MGKRYPTLGLVLIAIGFVGLLLLSGGGGWGLGPG